MQTHLITNPFTLAGRRLRAPLIALAVVIATTGCIQIDEQITFNADGGGIYEATSMIDTTALEVIAQQDPSASGILDGATVTDENKQEARAKYGPNAVLDPASENYDGHVYRGGTLKVPFTSAAQFNDIASKSVEQTNGPASLGAIPFKVTVEGGVYTLTGRMEALTGPEGSSEAALFEDAERNLSVTVTGTVISHNADDKDGRTYTWSIYATDPSRDVQISWRPRG